MGSLAVGGGEIASKIEAGAVGMPLLLGYVAGPSNLAAGNFQLARGNSKGHSYVTYASMTASVMGGAGASTETASAASGVVYGFGVIGPSGGAVAGGCVNLLDGATSRWIISLSTNNINEYKNFGPRGIGHGTNIRIEIRGIPAAAIPDVRTMLLMSNDVTDA